MAALFTGGIALPHIAASRQRRPGRPVRPADAGRRDDRRARHHRARRRLRRRRHHHHRRPRRRPLRRQRRQDLHHQRRPRRLRDHRGPHRRPRRTAGVSLLVVEKGTPGFTVDRSLRKMGWHCSDTAELSYVDVRVPVANLVGEENSGFLQIAEQFVVERIALAVHAYGIAARSLDADRGVLPRPRDLRQAADQPPGGAPPARRDAPPGRGRAHLHARGRRAGTSPGRTSIAEACLAKQTAVDCATYVCDQAVQLHGGTGYMHGTEVERHYRDARILPIGGGATEVLTDLAAKLLGLRVMSDDRRPPRGDAGEARRPRHRAREGGRRRRREVRRRATTGAASCCPASGSSCSSTRARRSSSCRRWPAGAPTSPSAPAWSPASASSRASSA